MQTFEQGVQNSCNPVFMDLGIKLGSTKFMEYFTAFGLTQRTGIELVGEASSIYYRDTMSDVDLATSSFGQGIQVTPIQLITATIFWLRSSVGTKRVFAYFCHNRQK